MRLTDLNPEFLDAGGEGVFQSDGSPAPLRIGVGLQFDCPCPRCTARRTGDRDADYHLRHFVPFENPLGGGEGETRHPKWQRRGDTFDTLQLSPSILSDVAKGGCGWHGYVGLSIPGEVTTC